MLKTHYALPIAALGLAILTLLVSSLIAVAVIRALPGRDLAQVVPGHELRVIADVPNAGERSGPSLDAAVIDRRSQAGKPDLCGFVGAA